MKDSLVFKKVTAGCYKVQTSNGAIIGELILDVDGDFYLWLNEHRRGAIAEWILREIANELNRLNFDNTEFLREYPCVFI